jgi:hypothetical protein
MQRADGLRELFAGMHKLRDVVGRGVEVVW